MNSESQLGGGSFGAVFKGMFGNEEVAAKTYFSFRTPEMFGLVNKDNMRRALEEVFNELSALSQLRHPNLVRFRGVMYEQQPNENFVVPLWIVMDYVDDGKTLQKLIYEQPQTTPLLNPSIKDIVIQIADVLVYFDSIGFVHRDLEPENILINNKGAFGEVYKAKFQGEEVAAKINFAFLNPEFYGLEELANLRGAIQGVVSGLFCLSQWNHFNIVQFRALFWDNLELPLQGKFQNGL
jgi:serine/threonine protein kinase